MDGPAETTDAGDSENDNLVTGKRRQATLYDAVAGMYPVAIESRNQFDKLLTRIIGRVTSTHALQGDQSQPSQRPHKRSRRAADANPRLRSSQPSRTAVLSPEEVLFRRVNAPTRYAERDIYFANEHLPDGGRSVLPDSDMLKAFHVYASHFFAENYGKDDDGSLHKPRVKAEDEPAIEDRRRLQPRRAVPIDERSMDETALLAFGILLEEANRELLGATGDLVFTEGIESEDDTNG